MRTYFVDFYKMAKDLLPHFLQKKAAMAWVTASDFFWITVDGQAWGTDSAARHLAWLRALMAPLQSLNVAFREYVAEVRYAMYLTGQVIYLEHYLNDLYDPVARRIYIEDGDAGVPLFLYNKEEAQAPIIIYNKAESETAPVLFIKADVEGQFDFAIVIPWANIPDVEALKMRSRVNKYKIAGKRYDIVVTPGGPAWP
jgi:hypothetical protein